MNYNSVHYDATNDMKAVTDATLIALVRACPNLTRLQLQGTSGLTDDSLLAIYEHCPKLTALEVSRASGGKNVFTPRVFTALTENPTWMPKLKTLSLSSALGLYCSNTRKEKNQGEHAMITMSKARPKLLFARVSISEEKNWGDWDLVKTYSKYNNGSRA
ncbi:hypothetical protein QBC34DRAFT_379371 [Podospora aff. communis PSN243]|uniref:Uncharacterized protein n=1 Tax=Podospora aff. communis PSN243 TaxID=3040156 RepID=A0AAV9GMV8_9PEZI|nr:hypothetical protein QBC34DRAFT_379371 [Podospora aff. communis PSN243]